LKLSRDVLDCINGDFSSKSYAHGNYWILKNFIKGSVYFKCHSSITYTTHTDVTYLSNVIPLLKRWQGPLSVAVYAPGDDFNATLHSIFYLRNCNKYSRLVRKYTTFHLFFEEQYSFAKVPESENMKMTCESAREFFRYPVEKTFKHKRNLAYPINVGRNLARNASLTHFILASDIELYPNPGFIFNFLTMMARNSSRQFLKEKK
jgi:beta-1,4-glucuronyltransferase 1